MAVNVVLGPDAKVDIGPTFVPFRVVSGRLRDVAHVNETTDSESPNESTECHPRGFQTLMVEFEVQFDTDEDNPTVAMFTNNLSLAPGNRIPMDIWPEGREVNNSNWGLPNVVIESISPGFMVRGTTPQGGVVTGRTTGYYKRPYEVDQDVASVPYIR